MKSAFITDGYTREGYIAETEFYPAARIQYRPATVQERIVIKDKIAREALRRDATAGEKLLNEWIVTHLLKWDVKDEDGRDVSITSENLGRLNPAFGFRLHAILMGDSICDTDPDTGEAGTDEKQATKN